MTVYPCPLEGPRRPLAPGISQVQQRYPIAPVYVQNVSTPAQSVQTKIFGVPASATPDPSCCICSRKLPEGKTGKYNFLVYFPSKCRYLSSGGAGLYVDKMSVHLPYQHLSRHFGRETRRHRILHGLYVVENFPEKFSVTSNFIVYFSDVCR